MAKSSYGSSTTKLESTVYFRELGVRVAGLRRARGMTQAELARAVGKSQQAVFAYELGERRISVLTLCKLAKVFDVSVEELVGLSRPTRAQTTSKLSPRVMRHAQRIDALPISQQRFVIRIVDSLEAANAQ